MTVYTTLITTAQLADRQGHADLAIVDCRFELANTGAGEAAYAAAHIPGAAYAHLDRDLSGPTTGSNGRHPLPSPQALAATLGRLGIDASTQVVAYDQEAGSFASRLWWLLRWLGHDAVAVLDGGFAAWTREGRPTRAGNETPEPRLFTGTPRPGMTADAAEIGTLVGDAGAVLLDARAPERYRGEIEPIDRVPGHIPGAINHPYQQNVRDGRFLPAAALRAAFEASTRGASPDRVVCYCGSGVTACHNLLAMEHAGLKGARLYPGSWSEWASDSSRPVEKG